MPDQFQAPGGRSGDGWSRIVAGFVVPRMNFPPWFAGTRPFAVHNHRASVVAQTKAQKNFPPVKQTKPRIVAETSPQPRSVLPAPVGVWPRDNWPVRLPDRLPSA